MYNGGGRLYHPLLLPSSTLPTSCNHIKANECQESAAAGCRYKGEIASNPPLQELQCQPRQCY